MTELSKYAGNAKKVIRIPENGEDVTVYESVKEAASCNGVNIVTIRRWVRDGKLHDGYTFHFRKPEKEFKMPEREVIGTESFRRSPYSGLRRNI